jgi:hypothetical protein
MALNRQMAAGDPRWHAATGSVRDRGAGPVPVSRQIVT